MNEKTLERFGSTICIRWSAQSSKLKDQLINYLVRLFGDTFYKRGVTTKVRAYLKYVRDKYRVHLKKNHRYERPPMIIEREWKDLLDDEMDNTLKKEGRTLPSPTMYVIIGIM